MNSAFSVALQPLLTLAKALVVGNVFALFMWAAIVWIEYLQSPRLPGLGAVAGGWTLEMHRPLNIGLLSLAFGAGVWLVFRAVNQ